MKLYTTIVLMFVSLASVVVSKEIQKQGEPPVDAEKVKNKENPRREAALRAIREAAGTISLTRDDEEIGRVEKPAFVYEDTLRSSKDGSVWVLSLIHI